MNTYADKQVVVRRFSPFNTMEQPLFAYMPSTGEIREAIADEPDIQGWLVDGETVIEGPKTVVFYRDGAVAYIALDRKAIEIGPASGSVSHHRGVVVSVLTVEAGDGSRIRIRYLTPWWRLVFDDGSHPDLQFPLSAFARELLGATSGYLAPRQAAEQVNTLG